jgi:acyl-CoA thioesterase-1
MKSDSVLKEIFWPRVARPQNDGGRRIGIILSSVFFGCFIFLTAAGCQKREIKNIHSTGKNIICFGDSLTYGYGVERGEDYPTALSKIAGVLVVNAGVSSQTSVDGMQRIETDVLAKNPRLVIIEFGGNDFLNKVEKKVTLRNIRAMVEKAQAKGAMAAVVDISAGPLFQEYQVEFKRIAAETGALFIPDVFKGIITNPSLKSDFFHPNKQGYQMVAQRIYRGIAPYLNSVKEN